MGKKAKKKAHTGLKEKRVSTSSTKTDQKENNLTSKTVNSAVVLGKDGNVCAHFEKAVDLAKVSSKLESAGPKGCEDCREVTIHQKGGKGKGKNGKTKGGINVTWICLHCGHFSCGGIGVLNRKNTHAVRHANQSQHPLIIQMENTNILWCFSCNKLIRLDKLNENDEQKAVLSDVVKLLKRQSSKTASMDVEDIWFGSGNVDTKINSENNVDSLQNMTGFYAVRGLSNLGNTCFFNSVMQNLLALDTLREYLLTYDGKMGPLTGALKKIFVETSSNSGVRNVINPNSLFVSICAKDSQFKGYQQQDSHELLRCLLDGLATEDLSANQSDKSSGVNWPTIPFSPTYIDTMFGGQISSTVCCLECGHSSVVHEPFLDLSLPIPAKEPPPKKTQPASRTKKTKLPPKVTGKHRPKFNKDGDSCSNVSGCDPSSSCECSSTIKRGPPDNASSKVSKSGGQEDDVVQLDWSGSATQSDVQEDYSWLDFLDPISLSDDQISVVKIEDDLVSLKSERNDVNHNINSFMDVVNEENVKPQSTVDFEDGPALQIQDNVVILLTDKEDSVTTVEHKKADTEMSSLTTSDEENTLGFVGLGNLFDEPEPSVASDLDDIDSTDFPVSVESCLADFVKTELLSGEHAWHCENCSKKLQQERRQKLKNQCKFTPALQKNTSKDECSSSKVLQVRSHPWSDGSNSGCVADTYGSNGPDENNRFSSTLPKEQEEKFEPNITCSDATSVSVCPGLPDETSSGGNSVDCCSGYADHVLVERLSQSEEDESAEDEANDGINSNSVKAMRSATKSMLIDKSPTILTIHLKRFAGRRGHLSKLKGHVVFKEFIDLQPYMDNRSTASDSCIYRLVGVVEHSGSMRSGHYVAYVRGGHRRGSRSEEDNHRQRCSVWYYASDAHVSETTLEEVLRSEAYILFYEKVLL